MKFVKLLLATALMTGSISPAFANPAVKILGASYGGSGCPDRSASVSASPDGQELTILFDKFAAQGNVSTESRKSCNLSIPIKVYPKATKFLSTMLITAATLLLKPQAACEQNTFSLEPAVQFLIGI